MTYEDAGMFAVIGTAMSVFFSLVAGFVTHLWWIISLLMTAGAVPGGKIVLAFIGVIIPPFWCLHGIYLWFNHW